MPVAGDSRAATAGQGPAFDLTFDVTFTDVRKAAADGRTTVTALISAASGGSANPTVKVSADGDNWYIRTDLFASDVPAGESEARTFETGCRWVAIAGDNATDDVDLLFTGG